MQVNKMKKKKNVIMSELIYWKKYLTFLSIFILGDQQKCFLFITRHHIYVVMTKSPHKEINMGQGQITGEEFREIMLKIQRVQWYIQEQRIQFMLDI